MEEGQLGATAASVAGAWPLVGRDDELQALEAALETGARALFLLGGAGSGKTRLARELTERRRTAGWTTATARATEATRPVPLGALAHLVPIGESATPHAVIGGLRRALAAEHDAPGPALLHLDDAHQLDPSSATALVGLVESGAVRLVLTARLGTSLPDALGALRAADESRTVVVDDLSPEEGVALLARVLGPVDGIASAQLLALSGGNPLYLRELIIGGVAEGSLHPVGGVWQLRGALPQTEELAERIHARLATLGPGAREALELVALGEPLGLDLLEELTSLEALEELERTGTIRVEESGRRAEVRLAHPLYGEVLRASLEEGARREGARRLAGALAATGARRATDAGPLIRWQVLAGIPTDADRILRSAEVARHHDDWVGAARLARLAHDAGLADAANLLAEAHYALGEFEEGDAIAEPAMARPGLLSDPALTSLHRTRAGVWFFASRDPLDVEAQVLEAEDQVADPHLKEMLRYARAAMCMWSGRVREARALAEPLLASDDPKVAVMAAIAVETVAATAGPADEAIALTDRWFATHSALPDLNGTNSPAFHLLIKVEALVNAGHLDDALALGDLGYRASVASLNRIAQMWFARALGTANLARGDAATARRWLLEQTALCRGTSWHRPLALGLSHLAVAEALLGRADAARAALDERDGLGVPVVELFTSEGVRGTAWARAAAGDREGAGALLVAGAAAAEAEGIGLLGALARVDAVRLGARDQAAPLAAAATTVGSRIVALGARWADALDDAPALEQVAEGFEQIGCLRHSAEVLAAASEAWADADEARRATGCRRRADALLALVGGSERAEDPTPTGSPGPGAPRLTAREREVVALVAEGLASKEVAERLFLSTRTVSNHLQNAYAKLGITGRGELRAALDQLALQAPD
ncbi:MAG TPA: LuxR C-terminal-related transcriptional regulator [Aquihabitans sp.]|nr:LuxR C-terminal-related transcriptional regulator [Aquihabitans sp.]